MLPVVEAKTTWGAGEYALMAQALEPASRVVIDEAEVSAGDRVIDVATGNGNAALVAAARGAEVLGIDVEPALLALAHRRASAAGMKIEWLEADAEALPVADGQADVVVSVFGSMYAADHAAAARELVRVLAPSGRLVLAAWTPGSLMPAMGALLAPYLPPPPPASGPPSRWGDPERLDALLKEAGARLMTTRLEQLTLAFEHAGTATDFLIRTGGHIVSQQKELSASGQWQALREDLAAFVSRRAERRADELLLRLDYLVSVAGHA
jgi:SAM-dependent methyltransferase